VKGQMMGLVFSRRRFSEAVKISGRKLNQCLAV